MTYSVQPSRRQDPTATAPARRARISAWAVGSAAALAFVRGHGEDLVPPGERRADRDVAPLDAPAGRVQRGPHRCLVAVKGVHAPSMHDVDQNIARSTSAMLPVATLPATSVSVEAGTNTTVAGPPEPSDPHTPVHELPTVTITVLTFGPNHMIPS